MDIHASIGACSNGGGIPSAQLGYNPCRRKSPREVQHRVEFVKGKWGREMNEMPHAQQLLRIPTLRGYKGGQIVIHPDSNGSGMVFNTLNTKEWQCISITSFGAIIHISHVCHDQLDNNGGGWER
jgi:hypothetical protein